MSTCAHCRFDEKAYQQDDHAMDDRPVFAAASKRDPMSDCPRWGIACHEAAHAVVAIIAGGFVKRATILPEDDCLGIVEWLQPRSSTLLETRIINSLAGKVAGAIVEKGFDPTVTSVRMAENPNVPSILAGLIQRRSVATCGNDVCEALNFMIRRRPSASIFSYQIEFERAQLAAIAILSDARIWRAVQDVARLLLVAETCQDADIRPIVTRHACDLTIWDLIRRHRLPLRL